MEIVNANQKNNHTGLLCEPYGNGGGGGGQQGQGTLESIAPVIKSQMSKVNAEDILIYQSALYNFVVIIICCLRRFSSHINKTSDISFGGIRASV